MSGARRATLLAALCCVSWPAAASLSIRVDPPDYDKRVAGNARWDVYLEGDIEIGAAERVRRELEQIGADGADVYLDSTGGSLIDGIDIGRLLRKLGASTTVGVRSSGASAVDPGKCFSACAIAFLGGVYRYVPSGSLYGVHRVSTSVRSPQDFDVGQMVAAQVAGYIRDMGVDGRLFERMAGVGGDQIYVLPPAELRALRVVNEGRLPTEWWSELSAQGRTVVGSQQTADGTNKLALACTGGSIELRLAYRPGNDPAAMMDSTASHVLVVDGVFMPLAPPSSLDGADGIVSASFELTAGQARRLIGASTLGPAVHAPGNAPAVVGFTIDVDAGAGRKIKTLIETCLAPD